MKVAIDWQGTLDTHPALWVLIDALQNSEIHCIILSAMPENRQGEREAEIEAAKMAVKLPYKVVYHSLENYHQSAGQAKAKYMQQNGIQVLVDDNKEVIDEVRKAGLLAVQV